MLEKQLDQKERKNDMTKYEKRQLEWEAFLNKQGDKKINRDKLYVIKDESDHCRADYIIEIERAEDWNDAVDYMKYIRNNEDDYEEYEDLSDIEIIEEYLKEHKIKYKLINIDILHTLYY